MNDRPYLRACSREQDPEGSPPRVSPRGGSAAAKHGLAQLKGLWIARLPGETAVEIREGLGSPARLEEHEGKIATDGDVLGIQLVGSLEREDRSPLVAANRIQPAQVLAVVSIPRNELDRALRAAERLGRPSGVGMNARQHRPGQ